MDLIIKNADLEQITIICSRIASPSFDEMLDDERLEEIAKHINNGDSPSQAKQKWQEEIVNKAEERVAEDGTKRIDDIKKELTPAVQTEVVHLKTEPFVTEEELHLDGPPADMKSLDDVMRIASEHAKKGNIELVHQIVEKYGVKKVRQLRSDQLQAVYNELAEALND